MKPFFFAALFIIISILFLQQISFADAQKGEIEGAPDPDPRGLGGILKRFVIKTLNKALSKAADSLKNRCPEAYHKMVSHIEEALDQVRNGQGPMAIVSVVAAINEAAACFQSAIVIAILKVALLVLGKLK
nr:pectinesterase inhibitor-like [Ipomoea batatas]